MQVKVIWDAKDKAKVFWHGRKSHAKTIIEASFKPEAEILSAMVI
jgi:hypothetical protein